MSASPSLNSMIPFDSAGVSLRAVRLARILDRLGAGQYDIRLTVNEIESASWKVEIDGVDVDGQPVNQRHAIAKTYLSE